MNRNYYSSAFTLIELSIALVIIGLIVGGILVGADLIKQAELRAIITDQEKIKTAVVTFRGKFDCIPGDCVNATTYGFANSGNGDGMIGPTNGYLWGSSANIDETNWFWQELASQGFVAAVPFQVGNGGGPGGYAIPSRLHNNGIWLIGDSQRVTSGAAPAVTGPMYNVLKLSSAAAWYSGCLSIYEANRLDAKIDDGFPWTGNVQAASEQGDSVDAVAMDSSGSPASPCVVSPYQTYNNFYENAKKYPGNNCDLLFKLGF